MTPQADPMRDRLVTVTFERVIDGVLKGVEIRYPIALEDDFRTAEQLRGFLEEQADARFEEYRAEQLASLRAEVEQLRGGGETR